MATDRRLFFLMHRATRALTVYANVRTAEALGVSSAQLGTLYHVAKHPKCSLTEVADVLDLNKSAVSGMVGRLERADLVKREPNPRDGRGSLLSLTPHGEAVRARSLAVTRTLTAEITAGFSEDEVATVARFLGTIVDRFGSDDE